MKKKQTTAQRGGFVHMSLNVYADQYEQIKTLPNAQAFIRDAIDAAFKKMNDDQRRVLQDNLITHIF